MSKSLMGQLGFTFRLGNGSSTDVNNSSRSRVLGMFGRVLEVSENLSCLVGHLIGFRLGPQVEMHTQPNSATAES